MVSYTLELSKTTEWMGRYSSCTRQGLYSRVNSFWVCVNLSGKSSIPMAISTLDSTKNSKSMALVRWFTTMETYLKENGKTTKRMELEDLNSLKACTAASWLKIKR